MSYKLSIKIDSAWKLVSLQPRVCLLLLIEGLRTKKTLMGMPLRQPWKEVCSVGSYASEHSFGASRVTPSFVCFLWWCAKCMGGVGWCSKKIQCLNQPLGISGSNNFTPKVNRCQTKTDKLCRKTVHPFLQPCVLCRLLKWSNWSATNLKNGKATW